MHLVLRSLCDELSLQILSVEILVLLVDLLELTDESLLNLIHRLQILTVHLPFLIPNAIEVKFCKLVFTKPEALELLLASQ